MSEEAVYLKRCMECESANEPDAQTCDACGHEEFYPPEPAGTELECDHCGNAAVESPKGIFHEDMADKCKSCGFPGQVHVDDGNAYWTKNDDFWVYCEDANCTECGELAREDVENARELLHDIHPILEDYKALVGDLPGWAAAHPRLAKGVDKALKTLEARWGRPPPRCDADDCRNSPVQDGLCQHHFEKQQVQTADSGKLE